MRIRHNLVIGEGVPGAKKVEHLMDDGHNRPCRQTGRLISKSNCFALRCEDGDEYWLEMETIPQHLVDQDVRIDGTMFGKSLIAVEGIGPL
jgi:hypothetical protein